MLPAIHQQIKAERKFRGGCSLPTSRFRSHLRHLLNASRRDKRVLLLKNIILQEGGRGVCDAHLLARISPAPAGRISMECDSGSSVKLCRENSDLFKTS